VTWGNDDDWSDFGGASPARASFELAARTIQQQQQQQTQAPQSSTTSSTSSSNNNNNNNSPFKVPPPPAFKLHPRSTTPTKNKK